MSSGDEVYEVEAILDHKQYKRYRKFYVKWKGYDESENTWETERNLINDGLQDAITEYLKTADVEDAAAPAKSKRSTRTKSKLTAKKKTAKSRSTRAKTPTRGAAKKKAEAKKKTPQKKTPQKKTPQKKTPKKKTPKKSPAKKSSSSAKKRTRTPSRKKSPKKKSPKKAASPVQTTAQSPSAAAAEAVVSDPASFGPDGETAAANMELYLWTGLFLLFVCAHFVFIYMESSPAGTRHCKMSGAQAECENRWKDTIHMLQAVTACLPTPVALAGLVSHVNSSRTYPKFISIALVWFAAASIVTQRFDGADASDDASRVLFQRLLPVVAHFALAGAFWLPPEDGATPSLHLVRAAAPLVVIGAFLQPQSSFTALRLEQASTPEFAVAAAAVGANALALWRAFARLGYGGIGWRSRRATKQIIGLCGCLASTFSMMVELQGESVLNIKSPQRTWLHLAAEWLAVGLLTSSALMYCVDDTEE